MIDKRDISYTQGTPQTPVSSGKVVKTTAPSVPKPSRVTTTRTPSTSSPLTIKESWSSPTPTPTTPVMGPVAPSTIERRLMTSSVPSQQQIGESLYQKRVSTLQPTIPKPTTPTIQRPTAMEERIMRTSPTLGKVIYEKRTGTTYAPPVTKTQIIREQYQAPVKPLETATTPASSKTIQQRLERIKAVQDYLKGRISSKQPVITREINTILRGGRITPTTTTKITPPKTLSKNEGIQKYFDQYNVLDTMESQLSTAIGVLSNATFQDDLEYTIRTDAGKEKVVSGTEARKWAEEKVNELKESQLKLAENRGELWSFVTDAQNQWHPDTTIIEYNPATHHVNNRGEVVEGQASDYVKGESVRYQPHFPYAGAERYHYYKKAIERGGPLGSFMTALTGEDPLGLASAYYVATGDKQRAIDVKVKALHGVKEAQKGGLSGVGWYLNMPTTQIGLAAIGGEAIGAGTTYLSTVAPKAGLIAKAGMLVPAGAMVYQEGANLKGMYERGEYGELLGRGVTLGLSAYAGAKGFKKGQDIGQVKGLRTKALATVKDPSQRAKLSEYYKGLDQVQKEYLKLPKSQRMQVEKIVGVKDQPNYVPKAGELPIDNLSKTEAKLVQKAISQLQGKYKTQIGGSASQYIQTGGKTRLAHDLDVLIGERKIGVPKHLAEGGYPSKGLRGWAGQAKLKIYTALGLKNKSRVDDFLDDALNIINRDLKSQGKTPWTKAKLQSLLDVHDKPRVGQLLREYDYGTYARKGTKSGIFKDVMSLEEQLARKGQTLVDPIHLGRGKDIPDFYKIAKLKTEAHPVLGKSLSKRLTKMEGWTPALEEGTMRFPTYRTPSGQLMYVTDATPEGIFKPGTSFYELNPDIAPTVPRTRWQSYLWKRGVKPPVRAWEIPDIGSGRVHPEMMLEFVPEAYSGPLPLGMRAGQYIGTAVKTGLSKISQVGKPKPSEISVPKGKEIDLWRKMTREHLVGDTSDFSGLKDDLVFHHTNYLTNEGVTLTKQEHQMFHDIANKAKAGEKLNTFEEAFYLRYKPVNDMTLQNRIIGLKNFLSKNSKYIGEFEGAEVVSETPVLSKKWQPTSTDITTTTVAEKPIISEPLASKVEPTTTVKIEDVPILEKMFMGEAEKYKTTGLLGPDEFYHGTSKPDIVSKYGLKPEYGQVQGKVFLTKDLDIAKHYAGDSGGVVKVKLTPQQMKNLMLHEKDYAFTLTEPVYPSQVTGTAPKLGLSYPSTSTYPTTPTTYTPYKLGSTQIPKTTYPSLSKKTPYQLSKYQPYRPESSYPIKETYMPSEAGKYPKAKTYPDLYPESTLSQGKYPESYPIEETYPKYPDYTKPTGYQPYPIYEETPPYTYAPSETPSPTIPSYVPPSLPDYYQPYPPYPEYPVPPYPYPETYPYSEEYPPSRKAIRSMPGGIPSERRPSSKKEGITSGQWLLDYKERLHEVPDFWKATSRTFGRWRRPKAQKPSTRKPSFFKITG